MLAQAAHADPPKPTFEDAGVLSVMKFDVLVHAAFVPTSEQVTRLERELNIANDLLCDATDGRVWLNDARLQVGKAASSANILWYPQFDARSRRTRSICSTQIRPDP